MASTYYNSFGPQPAENEGPDAPFEHLREATITDGNANADLSYTHLPRGHSRNNPPPDGWIYPHKKGIGRMSNLESFKLEIEEMTQKGMKCQAIAEALIQRGVQTSDRAVSRVRIKWGMRKRAQRKVKTPPPGSEAARLSARSKVQAVRKSELIRMTEEGLSAEEIYQNLTARGMELKKGIATVLRLQSAWGIAHDKKRWVVNFRHQCHKTAKAKQVEAFKEIAKELGVQDIDIWLPGKMNEEASRLARHELALELMGEHAPTNPERRKLQNPRRTDGPYVRRAYGSETSRFNADSDGDSPAPTRRPRSDVGPRNSLDGAHQDTGPSSDLGQQCFLGDMGVQLSERYAPLNDQRDDELYVSEDGHEGDVAGDCAGRGLERIDQIIPQPTTASRLILCNDHIEGSSVCSSRASSRPADREKGRTLRKAAAKTSPTPHFEAPMSLLQTNIPPNPGASDLSALSHGSIAGVANISVAPAASLVAVAATIKTSPMPLLVVQAEESEANKSTLNVLEQYNAAAKIYKELLEARNENKPLSGSLTRLPPSVKEVGIAKRKLKEATKAMMLALD